MIEKFDLAVLDMNSALHEYGLIAQDSYITPYAAVLAMIFSIGITIAFYELIVIRSRYGDFIVKKISPPLFTISIFALLYFSASKAVITIAAVIVITVTLIYWGKYENVKKIIDKIF